MYHILICDDEADIVNALKIYLQDDQYKLFTAYDGVEALEVMAKQEIHLVLMDIMMPKMDGIQTMVKIREHSNVPVILLTAKSQDVDKVLGLNVGADDYITKPFNPVEVVARVKSQLRRYMQLGEPGVLCHSAGDWSYDTLIANIQAHCVQTGEWKPREENSFAPALCNRIDRNTGGIVIAAKNAEALRILNDKIREREIDKLYLCAVIGRPKPASGTLRNWIFKDAEKNQVYVRKTSCPGAKEAITEYRTLKTAGGLSLVECRLLTGRTHQIRAQLAAAGAPLLGDGKYGSERINREFHEKGQALYSYKLTFDFPTDAGALNYLRGRSFAVSRVDFAEKYFDFKISVDK